MCRNIKTLFNFDPPATDDEIRAAALQFVRKLSGFNAPSRANAAAFNQAVDDVTATATVLVHSLITLSPPKNRALERERLKLASLKRFGRGNERATGADSDGAVAEEGRTPTIGRRGTNAPDG
jgi:hypothetical protein